MGTRLSVLYPGRVPYGEAYGLQQRISAAVREGANPTLILLEHPPTYTLGARGNEHNVLASSGRLAHLGAEVVRTDRGGDVTFHGPGQIVGYGIVDLRRLGLGVSDYVCRLEQILIDALASFGVTGARCELGRGVWVGSAKIAAIGVRVSRGVTTHGFALNVNTDLGWFDHIVPCGLPGVRVTSMAAVGGRAFDLEIVQDVLTREYSSQLQLMPTSMAEVFV